LETFELLQMFARAQVGIHPNDGNGHTFDTALYQIESGGKPLCDSCWLWYILPGPPMMTPSGEDLGRCGCGRCPQGPAFRYALCTPDEGREFLSFVTELPGFGRVSLGDNYVRMLKAIRAQLSCGTPIQDLLQSRMEVERLWMSVWFFSQLLWDEDLHEVCTDMVERLRCALAIDLVAVAV
jgi:hypothetical protein